MTSRGDLLELAGPRAIEDSIRAQVPLLVVGLGEITSPVSVGIRIVGAGGERSRDEGLGPTDPALVVTSRETANVDPGEKL
jgi:hypothetical protein